MTHTHLIYAGIPKLTELLDEFRECHRQLSSESVQKHTRLLEILQARETELCSILVRLTTQGAWSTWWSNSFSLPLSTFAECILAEDTVYTLCLLTITALAVHAEVPEALKILDQLVDCDRILATFQKPVSPCPAQTAGQADKICSTTATPKAGEAELNAQAM